MAELGTIGFFVMTMFLIIIPFVPALFEWLRPTASEPLIVRAGVRETRYFARMFRKMISSFFPEGLTGKGKFSFTGVLPSGIPCHVVGDDGTDFISATEIERGRVNKMILSEIALDIPGEVQYEHEIFSQSEIRCGEKATLEAVYGEASVFLGKKAVVRQWVHANKNIVACEQSQLLGRVSAEQKIRFLPVCYFQQVHAPVIEFGEPPAVIDEEPCALPLCRKYIEGDARVPHGRTFTGHIIAKGNVYVGRGTRVLGSIKSYGDLWVAHGSHVAGSLVAHGNIHIGSGCRVMGPILAEGNISIGTQSAIGLLRFPTTIHGARIRIASQVVCHGTIWPADWGCVK